mmetsp:Transcript_32414/g.49582  ORF Transcript_32414/g.49582 Transcript_32414/m.49582 type:complete len:85 (+) Transcript_32414:1223-1477(+)
MQHQQYFSTLSAFSLKIIEISNPPTTSEITTGLILPSPANGFAFSFHIGPEGLDWGVIWKTIMEWVVWVLDWLGISVWLGLSVL